ncbi:ArsR family transcriptional regulator [Paenibacillus profundus]|uniref:ArsR family transcriptional regulator n=1 Tax=Paenibacillus profundus TaxID=1173085 RepID=A0ABS8YNK5_9BACL|nr:ArsR family transcriptional regulator [Paenibacillus profundus]MCE5171174.1 ArsR family transcriptional regulator [Paenibacillus profundus]
MKIEVSVQNMTFLECLSSETRVKIIELLNEKPLNIKEMSQALGISSAIVTKHIQKLTEAGIVSCASVAGKRGIQKICSLQMKQAILEFRPKRARPLTHTVSIPIGQYAACEVRPTCGLASSERIIGVMDDPRYFADPAHVRASHLWFGSGYVEYRLPNFLLGNQAARSLEISLELCSEAPGYNEAWPSDISFYINDIPIGMWTCPGDFGERKGVYTPSWWNNGTQYGLLKTISVSDRGTYVDGVRMSDVTIDDVNIQFGKDIGFRIASHDTSVNPGGVSLFGKHFGNYNQDIDVILAYDIIGSKGN